MKRSMLPLFSLFLVLWLSTRGHVAHRPLFDLADVLNIEALLPKGEHYETDRSRYA